MKSFICGNSVSVWLSACLCTAFNRDVCFETIPKSGKHFPQMSLTTSSSSLPANSLNAPIVFTYTFVWISTTGTQTLLDVIRTPTTSTTQRVRLIPSLTER